MCLHVRACIHNSWFESSESGCWYFTEVERQHISRQLLSLHVKGAV